MIWLAERPIFQPWAGQLLREAMAASVQYLGSPLRFVVHDVQAAIAAAATAGGKAVEKTYERARFTSQSIKLRRPTTKPPAQPRLC